MESGKITPPRQIKLGLKLALALEGPLPLKGFPPGRARIRQRPSAFVQVFIRPPEGGVRRFYVEEIDGCWYPAIEESANRVAENNFPKEFELLFDKASGESVSKVRVLKANPKALQGCGDLS